MEESKYKMTKKQLGIAVLAGILIPVAGVYVARSTVGVPVGESVKIQNIESLVVSKKIETSSNMALNIALEQPVNGPIGSSDEYYITFKIQGRDVKFDNKEAYNKFNVGDRVNLQLREVYRKFQKGSWDLTQNHIEERFDRYELLNTSPVDKK